MPEFDTRWHNDPRLHRYGLAFLDPGTPLGAAIVGNAGLLDGPAHGDHQHPSSGLVYATVDRPSAVGINGSQIYDNDLNKPLWSDGAVWRDAIGTAV